MPFVYVVQSKTTDRFYVGVTADLKERLIWHIDYNKNEGFTKKGIPWEYYFTLEVENMTIALKIERHIKRMKSRVYIQNLVKYPEISMKLLEKYS
ncbi:GIY-YIG nuclease family protein [Euzebyella marina]|uniref:GIY-YIG nuclease family protein n=1 Tax=Euzebyella marina TaxID=1761453 RepID=A0A3G2L267_9FLAO|nr:GIY-YIG nuclease family protein [Euzebyella marina]AYN66350.1 GIY-YIG nuclease family protein [Euzebyella marina]